MLLRGGSSAPASCRIVRAASQFVQNTAPDARFGRAAAPTRNDMNDLILETRGLTKEFKGFVAVKDVG
jgi:hypothetical protein